MAGILPTSIGQVEDQSRSAGNALLEILSRQAQNNPWNELRNIIDTNYSKAIKAQESELLANAIDTFQRRREAGQDVNQALEGLDSRITGSKAFQNRTDKIRESLLLQSQDDRAQREQDHRFQRQALEDQATYFAADFLNFTKKYGPGSEAVWMDQNQSALKKNPLAYNKVMGLVQGDQSLLNTAPGVDAAKVEEFLKADTGAFDQTLADANKIERELAKLGLTPENMQENLTQEIFDKWVMEEAKNRGYTGEMFSSFRDNMQKAMNQLVDKANATPGGSTALVLPAMKKFLRESKWSWVPFNTAADVVHIDDAGDWMQKNFSVFDENKKAWEKVAPFLEMARADPFAAQKAQTYLTTQINKIKEGVGRKELDARQAQQMLNAAYQTASMMTQNQNVARQMVSDVAQSIK